MYIRRVKLEHFKKHEALDLTFTRGINAICGPNGAGKSSIIEAIGYALFNYKPYRSASELIRKGAKRANILVEFEAAVDQRLYSVERQISLKSGGRYVIRDAATSAVISEGATDSQEHLQHLLGADPDSKLPKLFGTILGVPQGTLTAAFLETPDKRKSIFAPLLRVEEYESAWIRMKDLFLKPLKDEFERQKLTLEHTKERLSTLPDKQKECVQLTRNIEEFQKELKELETQKPVLESRVSLLDKLREQRNTLLQQKLFLQKQQQQAQKILEQRKKEHEEATKAYTIIKEEEESYKLFQANTKEYELIRKKRDSYLKEKETLQSEESALNQQRANLLRLSQRIEELHHSQKEHDQLLPLVEKRNETERKERILREQLSSFSYVEQRKKDLQLEILTHEAEEKRLIRRTEELKRLQPMVEQLKQIKSDGEKWRMKRDEWHVEQSIRQEQINKLKQLQVDLQQAFRHIQQTKQHEQNAHSTYHEIIQQLPARKKELERLQQQLQRLEIQLEREEQFRKSVSGGICPFFKENCRNVPEGQKLEQYMTSSIKRSGQELGMLKKRTFKQGEETQAAQRAQEKLQTEGERAKIRIETKQQEIQKIEKHTHEMQEKLSQHPDRQESLNKANQNLGMLRQRYKELKPLAEKAENLHPEQDRLQFLQKELSRQRTEVNKLKQKESELLAIKKIYLPLKEQLKELEKPYMRAQQLIHNLKELPSLQTEHRQTQQKLNQQAEQFEQKRLKLEQLQPIVESAQKLEESLRETRPGYEKYLHFQQAASKIGQTTHALQVSQEQNEQLQKELAQDNEELTELDAFNDDEFKEKTIALQENIRKLGILSGRIPELCDRQKRVAAELEDLNEKQAKLEEEEITQAHKSEVIECGEMVRKVFKAAGPHMTRTLIYSISAEADRIFRTLLDRYHLHLQWDESFELSIEEGGNERSFFNLSGGEQMAAALSVRMALIKELSSVRIAFFDEPTAHMDAARRYNLATQLGQVEGFDQLMVISHDDTFETLTDHVVRLEGF